MQRNKGYTLLELLIANGLGIMLIAGVMQIFSSNSQSIRVVDASSRVQESGRTALDLLTEDIRMADYWGCMPPASSITNHLDPTDPQFDSEVHSPDSSDGLSGVNETAAGITIPGAAVVTTLPKITVRAGTDTMKFRASTS